MRAAASPAPAAVNTTGDSSPIRFSGMRPVYIADVTAAGDSRDFTAVLRRRGALLGALHVDLQQDRPGDAEADGPHRLGVARGVRGLRLDVGRPHLKLLHRTGDPRDGDADGRALEEQGERQRHGQHPDGPEPDTITDAQITVLGESSVPSAKLTVPFLVAVVRP